MKKLISILLLAALLLSGCGSKSTAPKESAKSAKPSIAKKLEKYKSVDWNSVKETPAKDFTYEIDEALDGYDPIQVIRLLTYEGNDPIVKVPEIIDGMKVVYLDNGLFQGNTNLTHVYLPDTIIMTRDSELTFQGCTSLVQARISAHGICPGLFYECTALREVVLEGGKYADRVVPGYAFYHCTSLTEVSCNENYYGIGVSAFEGCTELKSIQLPGVTVVSEAAFKDCSNLTDLTLNTDNSAFYEDALDGCTSLRDISFVDTGKGGERGKFTVENGVFYQLWDDESHMLKVLAGNDGNSIPLREDITWISKRAFSLCDIRKFEVPATVKEIHPFAFADCETLESVTLAPGIALDGVNWHAFDNCPALKTVDFSNDTGKGGYEFTFENSPKIKDVKYPG